MEFWNFFLSSEEKTHELGPVVSLALTVPEEGRICTEPLSNLSC